MPSPDLDPRTVLVAGGCGYIGSHMVRMLRDQGLRPVVIDNLSTGHADAVQPGELRRGDIGDRTLVGAVLRETRPACVMHFAAASLVGESTHNPSKYWRNNLEQTVGLLDALVEGGLPAFIFSSTAAVFGNPLETPIRESHPCHPVNPYGHTKLAVEYLLQDYGQAYGLRSIVLRYFNAAGAHPDGSLGERHDPETHLIPLVLQAASGRRPEIARYGRQHDTPDGSCIRDYIHVQDLCTAHLLALRRLVAGGVSDTYNLGNGRGHSVSEVIAAARRVTGRTIAVRDEPARAGDPPILVADATRARQELGWKPLYPGLDHILAHAWQWERRQQAARAVAAA
jgi:UDP-glucose 4-epimerase